jgi:DNA processing protein
MGRGKAWEAALGLAWLGPFGHHVLLRRARDDGIEAIWRADRKKLRAWGMRERTIDAFRKRRAAFHLADAMSVLAAKQVRFVAYGESDYPLEFLHLSDPPVGMFVRAPGEAWERLLAVPRITVVGTRRTTPLGLRATEQFATAFAAAGILVVSGMALGVDARAHRAVLDIRGATAAVLGSGVDVVYPQLNRWLYEKIRSDGVIMSELPPGAPPAPWTFPHRNRLLAALGDAVLVTEAPPGSGALQTVDAALELGRLVFAVPGSVYAEGYRGCNRLLYEGATPAIEPCVTVEDFLLQTRIEREHRSTDKGQACRESGVDCGSQGVISRNDRVWCALRPEPCSIDLLVERTGLAVRELSAALVQLELEGVVHKAGPGIYARGP